MRKPLNTVGIVIVGLVAAALSSSVTPPARAQSPSERPVKPGPLSSGLRELAIPALALASADPQLEPLTEGPGTPIRTADGAVLVDIRVSATSPEVLDRLRGAGALISFVSEELQTVTAEVPVANLGSVAALGPDVIWMSEVLQPAVNSICPTGLAVSEGSAQLLATSARSQFGVTGFGITIGVISDSYARATGTATTAATDVANGDLPGTTNTCGNTTPVVVQSDPTATGLVDEGRAMAQIVHDVAPGATIRVGTAVGGEPAFASTIRAMANAGAKVIVDDISYFAEPMYQDGVVGKAVEDVTTQGAAYFSSAGNSNTILGGRDVGSYETLAYRPTACPSTVAAFAIIDCHDFNAGPAADPTFGANQAGTSTFILGWNEPQFGITTDYDLFILNGSGVVVDSSTDPNISAGKAFEFAGVGGTGSIQVVVGRYAGAAPSRFRFVSSRSQLTSVEYSLPTGTDRIGNSLFGHNGSRSGVSVAAVPYNNANILESFSTRGPTTYCWGPVVGTTPAAPLPACESATIDVAATDGVVTSFFTPFSAGVFRFFGTSASAPHAAAVAALVRQRVPCLSPTHVIAGMKASASVLPAFTTDAQGAGRVNASTMFAAVPGICANTVKTIQVTGVNGVPVGGVGAVSLNVTVTGPESGGFTTVYPCGGIPNSSNLNYVSGQTVPNAVIAPVDASGNICIVSSAHKHVIVDVNGWFPISASGLQPLTPSRVLDTRNGIGGVPVGQLAAGAVLTKTVVGGNGIPGSGVAAVSLNVTVTEPQAGGFLTIYPCGTAPNASNLNFSVGQTVPNAVIAPLNASGQICVTSSATTHVIVDVNGWFPGTAFNPLAPTRLFDTRNNTGGVGSSPLASNSSLTFAVGGVGGVPASGVSAVALNVTVTQPSGPGYVTVYPCGSLPNASNLNFVPNQTVPNLVIAPLSGGGQVCFFTSAGTHLIADVSGYFPSGGSGFQALTPARDYDSRVQG